MIESNMTMKDAVPFRSPRNRRPNLKLLERTMSTIENPATLPVVVESSTHRLAWQRAIADAQDEIAMINEQIASLIRTENAAVTEANTICEVRIDAARRAMDRERADAAKVLEAGSSALRRRQADLSKTIAGLEAAMGATDCAILSGHWSRSAGR